jgi:hypothetical protein
MAPALGQWQSNAISVSDHEVRVGLFSTGSAGGSLFSTGESGIAGGAATQESGSFASTSLGSAAGVNAAAAEAGTAQAVQGVQQTAGNALTAVRGLAR